MYSVIVCTSFHCVSIRLDSLLCLSLPDLSLYTTDTLMSYHGDHDVEVREQVILHVQYLCPLLFCTLLEYTLRVICFLRFIFFRFSKLPIRTMIHQERNKFGSVRVAG